MLAGVLQAHRRFLAAALAPLLSSLVVIAAYVGYGLRRRPGDHPGGRVRRGASGSLAGGTTAGVVVLSLPLVVPALRTGSRLRPTLRFPPGVAARARALAGAGVIALVAQQASVAVTLWLTHSPRTVALGAVNVYTYVQAVYLLPYAVLAVPIATSAFPALAHGTGAQTAEDELAARGTLARGLQGIVLLTAGAAAVLMAVARPVGEFFGRSTAVPTSADGLRWPRCPAPCRRTRPGLVGFGVAAPAHPGAVRPWSAASCGRWRSAAGWAVAAPLPLALVPRGSGPGTTLGVLGVGSTLGHDAVRRLLTLLVRRAWGVEALRGAGRTLGAAVVALAIPLGVGDALGRLACRRVDCGTRSATAVLVGRGHPAGLLRGHAGR